MLRRISKTRMPARTGPTSDEEFLRFFREITSEYNLRASRLEGLLVECRPTRSAGPDMEPQMPSWEIPDVLMDTRLTREQLRQELPPLFDALRRIEGAISAVMVADLFSRGGRMRIFTEWGDDRIVEGYLEASRALGDSRPDRMSLDLEQSIDEWVDEMIRNGDNLRECPHRASDDLSEWEHSEFGAGRSRF